MIEERKDVEETKQTGKGGWLLYAVGSAFFASLDVDPSGKIGISGVESNLGTAIRTLRRARHGVGDGIYHRKAAGS